MLSRQPLLYVRSHLVYLVLSVPSSFGEDETKDYKSIRCPGQLVDKIITEQNTSTDTKSLRYPKLIGKSSEILRYRSYMIQYRQSNTQTVRTDNNSIAEPLARVQSLSRNVLEM